MYRTLTAIFMTGTGNSCRVAQWFVQMAGEQGIPAEMHQLRRAAQEGAIPRQALVVFTYPTHGFTAPWLMINYIRNLPRGNQTHALVVPNRAGVRVKGIFVPGLEGTSGYLIALLLWLRGYAVRGVMGVDMPSNWTAVHWGLSDANAAVITGMAEAKVKALLRTVLAGHKYFDGVIQLIVGVLLAPISLMYLILGQLLLAKLFFASEKCNGCALCQALCPKQAIRMTGWREQRPYWSYRCDSCMACMNFCPRNAIEVSPLFAVSVFYLAAVPVGVYGTKWAAGLGIGLEQMTLLHLGLQYVYVLAVVAAVYWLLHFVLNSRFARSVLGRLSHTRYFRRYRAAGITLRTIHQPGRLPGQEE